MSEFNKHLLGGKNELRNWSFEKLVSDPTGGDLHAGRFWLNTTSNEIKYYDGTAVQVVGSGGGGGGGPAIENAYADITALLADQGSQTEKAIQFVLDASGDSSITTGYAYYEKLVASTASTTDYRVVSKEESLITLNDLIPDYIQLSLGATQNIGGASGTQHKFNWTVQDHIDSSTFTHDTVTNNDDITILETGWYYIHHNLFATQTGANRTVQLGRLWVNGVIDPKFLPVTYGRGAGFGVYIGYQATYRKYFTAGDVVEVGVQVSDPDGTYVTNASATATTVMIHKEPGGSEGPTGPAGPPGDAPTELTMTSDEIDLGNTSGNFYAGTFTANTYTLINLVDFGIARVARIDTTGKVGFPAVTGSTQIAGDAFAASSEYDLWVENLPTVGTEHWFIKKS